MRVEDKLLKKKEVVDRELTLLLDRGDTVLMQATRYAVLSGGKRFRPLLLLSSGECFGASEKDLLPFACALELIHNYSLVHDDLPAMDDDDFRRSKPSCHKAYGEDIALLVGDGLLTLAFEVMAGADVDQNLLSKKEKIIHEISQLAGLNGMIGGQFLDIISSPENVAEDDYYDLILKKTGSLIIASLKVGATLGNASSSEIKGLEEYGRCLGLAFQIRDDIMDSFDEDQQESPLRPNAVSLFGLEEAKGKLGAFVEEAQRALERAHLDSEELRYLALRLLKIEGERDNEKDTG